MTITTLSSKGQVMIPKAIRSARESHEGQNLQILETGTGYYCARPRCFSPRNWIKWPDA